ncbi:MAG: SRPBCC family protein [Burkholderiales bacterium]
MSDADLIPITEEVAIEGTPTEVWPLIADPMAVVNCVPGAAITGRQEDGTYDASITVKFGPTIATFTGEVKVLYDEATHTCTVDGRGIDQRGASRALVRAAVSITGDKSSLLTVNGGFNVAGPLEAFASAGGVHVARALLAEFSKNVAAVIASRRAAPTQGEAAAAPIPAAELHGGRLLWRAFLGWARRIFRADKKPV